MNSDLNRPKANWIKFLLFVIVLLILINLGFLNYQILTDTNRLKEDFEVSQKEATNFVSQSAPSLIVENKPESPVYSQTDICPDSCLRSILEATTSGLTNRQPTVAPTVISNQLVKEFYIPLGTGSTAGRDWQSLGGAEAVIDLANYQKIKLVVFEASIRIPTGNGRAYAKLFNVTDQHDAWNSEVYTEGSLPQRAEANNVVLASGRKLYRVMMKSTMAYEAILDSARIKILLE